MAETEKAKERTGIKLDIFPDWKGKRISRGIGIEGTTEVDGKSVKLKQPFRFDVELPVPSTDEEAQTLYGVNLGDLVPEGVKKLSYDRDNVIGDMITEALVKGKDFSALEDPSPYGKALQDEMATPKEKRTSAATENKRKASELDSLYKEFNVDNMDDLRGAIALARESKKAKK